MGGVLIDWNPWEIVSRCALSKADSDILFREVFCCREWVSMDHGLMTQPEGYESICRRLPPELHEAAHACVFDWWKPPLKPIEGMAELIRELKGLGYGIYLLSNATSTLHQYFGRLPASECFDGWIVSADLKLLKPQREIYEALFETYDLDPAECFFIDDNSLNIDGCCAAGMPGTVFFRDMPRLRRELREAGVPCAEK